MVLINTTIAKKIVMSWQDLRRLPNNKIIRSMGIWIIVVPVSAKILSNEYFLKFDLSLPFTWYCFFFSALCFSLGNLVFTLKCPIIVKENDSLDDFNREGKIKKHLIKYAEDISFDIDSVQHPGAPNSPIGLRDQFWPIYFEANVQRIIARSICSCFYYLGFGLATYVVGENIYWVVKFILVS